MKNIKLAFLSFFLISLIVISCKTGIERKIDELFNDYNKKNIPGASLMIIKNGEPILIKSYGATNIEKGTKVNSNTNFRLASFTKQFTAMCIAKLEEQGKLNCQQTLDEIFPNFPAYGKEITINHLIHHTSGLIDYESLIPDTATVQVLDGDVLKIMMDLDSTYFPPGTKYNYSNSAYAVLANIIEKISGISFASYLKENIFDPLEMINTVAYERGISEVKHRAFGYTVENGDFVFKDQSLTSAVLGDGGIYSSVNDLFKWDQVLYTDKLVTSQSKQKIFTPDIIPDGTQTGYGFGWRLDELKGFKRQHHTGQTCGFTTIIQRYPDEKFTIIILTNRNKPMLGDLADNIAEFVLTNRTVL